MSARSSGATAALLAGLLIQLVQIGCAAQPPERPNLLLITVDTLRADALTCYGSKDGAGEHLCSVAGEGYRFAWAFSTAPSTAPSIASILTSRYPRDHGVSQDFRTRLPKEAETVAERLRTAGYATAAFVSNPVLSRVRGLDQGFDVYDDRMTRSERNRPRLKERDAGAATDAALAWFEAAEADDRPWFVWVHYQDPHGPYDPPAGSSPLARAGQPEGTGEPGRPARGHPPGPDGPVGAEDPARGALPLLRDHSGWNGLPAYQRLPGVVSVEGYRSRYADEIRYLDAHVARLLAAAHGAGRSLGVLLTADHGEAFGEDGFFCAHGHSVGLDQIRVPLLWRPPNAAARGGGTRGSAGTVVRAPVSTLDVAPTLLAAAGLDARDATPALDGPTAFDGLDMFEGLPLGATIVDSGSGDAGGRVLFAEQELRAAAIAGGSYYARDRVRFTGSVRDPVTGGVLPPLPPRLASLAGDGALPAYEPARAGDAAAVALESLLDRYLSGARLAPVGANDSLDAETRDALRALGYLQ